MPGAGDLRKPGWRRRAQEAYPNIDVYDIRCLEQFLSIDAGDLVLLPTYERHQEVYLGVVLLAAPLPHGECAQSAAKQQQRGRHRHDRAAGCRLECEFREERQTRRPVEIARRRRKTRTLR